MPHSNVHNFIRPKRHVKKNHNFIEPNYFIESHSNVHNFIGSNDSIGPHLKIHNCKLTQQTFKTQLIFII